MKRNRQLHIGVARRKKLVIDLPNDVGITLQLDHGPALKPGEKPRAMLWVHGGRWTKQKEYFLLEWPKERLRVGDSIDISLVEGHSKPTKLTKDEKYVEPEKSCGFCGKKTSEVKRLIEGESFFCRICDECVEACRVLIKGQHAV